MTYIDQAAVFAQLHDIGEGWRKAIVWVNDADTAWYPASTKRAYRGPGWVVYMVHPSGIHTYGLKGNAAHMVYRTDSEGNAS